MIGLAETHVKAAVWNCRTLAKIAPFLIGPNAEGADGATLVDRSETDHAPISD
jgi:hypothetical protein